MVEFVANRCWSFRTFSNTNTRNTRANASSIASLYFAFDLLFKKLVVRNSSMFCGSLQNWNALMQPSVQLLFIPIGLAEKCCDTHNPELQPYKKAQSFEFKPIINKYLSVDSLRSAMKDYQRKIFCLDLINSIFVLFHFWDMFTEMSKTFDKCKWFDITRQVDSRTNQHFLINNNKRNPNKIVWIREKVMNAK